ncbi:hypothetical protein [Mycobacterium sp.]|uniref:hypothetical protein n=1 Tax=Mycobacterium sp. TaxID=1785 RepID=UPI0031D75956
MTGNAGMIVFTERTLALLPAQRAAALCEGTVTIDLDTTDVEVYGRKKDGVEYNHQDQRVGRPHVASWAETETVLATALGSGVDDPRATADELLARALTRINGNYCRATSPPPMSTPSKARTPQTHTDTRPRRHPGQTRTPAHRRRSSAHPKTNCPACSRNRVSVGFARSAELAGPACRSDDGRRRSQQPRSLWAR